MLTLLRHAWTAAFALALAPWAAQAQASAYVPAMDPAYEDLEVLVAAGLVQDLVGGESPYSRAAFRRWAAEGSRRIAERGGSSPRVHEALARLDALFGGDGKPPPGFALRSPAVELWAARSPARDLGPGAASGIDGVLNPLLQGNQGRLAADGWTAAAEFGTEFAAGPLVFGTTPRFWGSRWRDGRNAEASATFVNAYARMVLGLVSVEAGRNHATLGHGRAGGAAISHNPRGLDMVRISTDRPFRLPGSLRRWGIWQVSALVARMDAERDTPRSVLAAFRLGYRPARSVEMGLVYLNHQGGEGAPSAGFLARVADLLLPVRGGAIQVSDKSGGADLRVTIARAKTQLYVNFLTTDMRRSLRQFVRGYWRDALWTAGVRAFGRGAQGRLDFWAEGRHAGPLVHTHHQFTSGLTIAGRVVGDPLGPNAWSIGAGAAWHAAGWKADMSAAWDHYSADAWVLASPRDQGGAREWTRTADNPDETRVRIVFEWRNTPLRDGVEASFRLGYEHVDNFGFAGSARDGVMARFSVGFRPGRDP